MNASEHTAALERLHFLMRLDPSPESRDGKELLALSAEVEAYERAVYPLNASSFESRKVAGRVLQVISELGLIYELQDAVRWFGLPQPLLGGKCPVDLIVTDTGAAEVFQLIAQIRDGAYT